MKRLLVLGAALGTLGGCNCISGDQVTGFKCAEGGACEEGFTCCADGYCRADCTGGSGGGAGGAGGNNAGGGTGGAGGEGGEGGATGGGGGSAGAGGSGGGAACQRDAPCTDNPGLCREGRISCDSGTPECVDGPNKPNGDACGIANVCVGGQCVTCTDGASCDTNANRCVEGVLSCSGSAPVCRDGTKQKLPGDSCGTNQVCDSAGQCVACTQGGACTGNPTACRNGQTDCRSGAPVCIDGTDKPAGTGCGNNLVCNGTGACVPCSAGSTCSTNPDPCKNGVQSCTGGAACTDGTPKAIGASCGTNRVCDATGACVGCTAMQACGTNPTPCKQGVSSCSTGAELCVDTAANRSPGTSCGPNLVCNAAGSCVACTQGAPCTGNPSACKQGVTECSSGAPVCVDGPMNVMNGAPCGNGLTCNGGICGMCTQGGACTGNPTPCRVGVQSCTGAMPVCNDGTMNRPPGTSCGTNQVCNTAGSCVACTAGAGCTTNPGAPCKQGIISCSTGAPVCVDGTNAMNGITCGQTQFGMYTACNYASTCSNSGSRTRGRTDFTCSSGACAATTTTETDTSGCARTQDGNSCGMTSCTNYGSCSYAGECANGGSRTRTCTALTCNGGTCNSGQFTETDTAGCARNQNGRMCGNGTVCGQYSACSYGSTCSTTGSQSRSCNDFTCGNGTCNQGSTYTQSQTCNRNTDGVACGTRVCGTCSACIPDCIREQQCTTPICLSGTCSGSEVDFVICGTCPITCQPR